MVSVIPGNMQTYNDTVHIRLVPVTVGIFLAQSRQNTFKMPLNGSYFPFFEQFAPASKLL